MFDLHLWQQVLWYSTLEDEAGRYRTKSRWPSGGRLMVNP
jgi:hypothetical protein